MTTPATGHPGPARPQQAATRHQCQPKTVCVPFMFTEGTSLRLAEATAGKGVTPLT